MHSESDHLWERRRLLQTLAAGTGGSLLLSCGETVDAAEQTSEPSVVFDDQRSDGKSVIVDRVSSDSGVTLVIRKNSMIYGTQHVDSGTHEQITVQLDTPITESKTISARLYPESGGKRLAIDHATIHVGDGAGQFLEGIDPTLIEPTSESGFNYPYYLYIPRGATEYDELPVLVEPTNTGFPTDDFSEHKAAGKNLIKNYVGRTIADTLLIPFLVPVFPRPLNDPINNLTYIQALDADTMSLDSGPLERVDLQLLKMVEHAKDHLEDDGYSMTDEGILLNGFSATGNFVDRFAVLHPNEVLSVTAGGLNGMALLPIDEAKGHTLNYHVGIADLDSYLDETHNLDSVNDVDQFLYMGAQDDADTLPDGDGPSETFTSKSLRETAQAVFEEDMITDRFPFCQKAYEQAGLTAQFRTYEGLGHVYAPPADLVEFHRRSLAGEDLSDFGTDLENGTTGQVVTDPPQPAFKTNSDDIIAGNSVTFDAAPTASGDTTVVSYTYDFGDGNSASGKRVSHTYSEPGTYQVSLIVEDYFGGTHRTIEEITVKTPSTTTPTASESGSSSNTGPETTSTEGPGFGIGTALTAVGAGAYMLTRQYRDDSDE